MARRMALNKQKRIQQLQELGLSPELSVYLETGDEDALNQFQMEQQELAEAIKEFTLSDFPLQDKLQVTENPLRNSIHDKSKRIGKIILDTETGQRKIVYSDTDIEKLST
jgi:hypothetical protein